MAHPPGLEPHSLKSPSPDCVVPGALDVRQLRRRIGERGHILLRVTGGSMGPWLVPGDIVVVGPSDPGKLNCGNIIVFSRDERLIVHRIIGKLGMTGNGERTWQTKGDSADESDAPVREGELVGIVVSIERDGHSLSLGSRRQMVFSWLLAQISPLSRFVYPGVRVLKNWSGIAAHRRRVERL